MKSGLKIFAIKAAEKDSRFAPINKNEFKDLNVGVSLLVHFERNLAWNDWEIGKHGILIRFQGEAGGSYSATYLPEVAPSQGWNHKEAIYSLIEKSGYELPITEKLLGNISLDRYQSSKYSLDYSDWVKR